MPLTHTASAFRTLGLRRSQLVAASCAVLVLRFCTLIRLRKPVKQHMHYRPDHWRHHNAKDLWNWHHPQQYTQDNDTERSSAEQQHVSSQRTGHAAEHASAASTDDNFSTGQNGCGKSLRAVRTVSNSGNRPHTPKILSTKAHAFRKHRRRRGPISATRTPRG